MSDYYAPSVGEMRAATQGEYAMSGAEFDRGMAAHEAEQRESIAVELLAEAEQSGPDRAYYLRYAAQLVRGTPDEV